jgi:hypothetical protein
LSHLLESSHSIAFGWYNEWIWKSLMCLTRANRTHVQIYRAHCLWRMDGSTSNAKDGVFRLSVEHWLPLVPETGPNSAEVEGFGRLQYARRNLWAAKCSRVLLDFLDFGPPLWNSTAKRGQRKSFDSVPEVVCTFRDTPQVPMPIKNSVRENLEITIQEVVRCSLWEILQSWSQLKDGHNLLFSFWLTYI